MPGWKREIETRIACLNLTPVREAEIVEELTDHLDDYYSDLLAGGATPEEASSRSLKARSWPCSAALWLFWWHDWD